MKENSRKSLQFYIQKVAEFEVVLLESLNEIYFKTFKDCFDVFMNDIWVKDDSNNVVFTLDINDFSLVQDMSKEEWFSKKPEKRFHILSDAMSEIDWKNLNEKEKVEWLKKFDLQALFKAIVFRNNSFKIFCKRNHIPGNKLNRTFRGMIHWRNNSADHKNIERFENMDDGLFCDNVLNPIKNLYELLYRNNKESCERIVNLVKKTEGEVKLPPIEIEEITKMLNLSIDDVKYHLEELNVSTKNNVVEGQDLRTLSQRILKLHGKSSNDFEFKQTEKENASVETSNLLYSLSKSKLTEEQVLQLTKEFNMIVDSSALLNQSYAQLLMYGLDEAMRKNNKKFLVFRRTRMELVEGERNYYEQKKLGVPENENDYIEYKGAVNVLDRLSERHLLVYGNGYTDSVSEEDDIETLIKTHPSNNICLVTLDDDYLKNDIVDKSENFITIRTVAKRIFVRSKYLSVNFKDHKMVMTNNDNKHKEEQKKESSRNYTVENNQIVERVTVEENQILNKEIVSSNGEKYKLIKKLGAGGEGVVYQTQFDDIVAKIYFKENITVNRQKKLKDMVNAKIDIENVAWPLEILLDDKKNTIGYIMKKVPYGCVEMGLSVLKISSNMVRQNILPNWDRLDLVLCAHAITTSFKKLHKRNILMGDINPRNIMVDPHNSNKVWFVDCDSYQFEKYNCPVGTPIFTSPRIYNQYGNQPNYATLFRTEEDEQYAIASLLFQILMAGQSPFASKREDNEGIEEAIKTGKFAYSRITDEEIPDGPYRMIWQNMLGTLKGRFQDVFIDGRITSTEDWVQELNSYKYSINQGWLSRDIFPKKYKSKNPEDFADFKCEICGKEANMPIEKYKSLVEKDYILACNECNIFLNRFRGKTTSVPCDRCGEMVCDVPEIKVVQNEYRDPGKREAILCGKCYYEKTIVK